MTMLSEGEATVLAMRLADAAQPIYGSELAELFIARAKQLILAYEPIMADGPEPE